jgi:hypothetical protein
VVWYLEGYRPVDLANSRRELQQGTELPTGGCRFQSSIELQPGSAPITHVELAFDPDSCQRLVEIGVEANPRPITSREGAQSDQSGGPVEGIGAAAVAGTINCSRTVLPGGWGNDPFVPGAVYSGNSCRAFMDSWYDEPARWAFGRGTYDDLPPVNEQLNFVEWTPDGTCAVATGTTGWVGYWQQWLTLTGWYRPSNDWSQSPDPIPCDQPIRSNSDVHFRNRAFCKFVAEHLLGPATGPIVGAFFPTDVRYQPNYIAGRSDGTVLAFSTIDKSGPCSSLLREGKRSSYY